jgi:hypothetical protein
MIGSGDASGLTALRYHTYTDEVNVFDAAVKFENPHAYYNAISPRETKSSGGVDIFFG